MAYNKVILEGNLTRDIEMRYTPSGTAIGHTGIAVNRRYKTATGEQKEEVMFIDLTLFGRTAEIANQYLRKGRNVLVDGRLTLEQWTAQDGTKRSRHVVTVENLQMLGGRDEGAQSYNTQPSPATSSDPYASAQQTATGTPAQQMPYEQKASAVQSSATPDIPEIDINEDEIPF